MSSSENLQPENADDGDNVEDTSIPTLSSDFFKIIKVNFYFHLIVHFQ